MGLFDRLFGSNTPANPNPQPDIRFGRYSDSYKDEAQYDAWDSSLEAFDKENFIDSYKAFFRYLRDDRQDNVKYWEENGGVRFQILQGSKTVTGFANAQKLKAEAKVAKAEMLNIGFMRRLIEQNFTLNYCRYALDEQNNIAIVFDTYTLDGSPYKLYYALKEIAVNADKQDDLLLDEFEMLKPVDNGSRIEIPEAEKEIKYSAIINHINAVFTEIDSGKLNAEQYPGGIAYLLLDLTYRLDYLTSPEGFMMETLERIHRTYFANDGKTTAQKNVSIRKELQKILERPKASLFQEMYHVIHTFGITSPENHDRLTGFIDGEIGNMDWYKDNRHDKVALAIPGYIVGYCLFNFALPKPSRELLQLYMMIVNPAYFESLGFTNRYSDAQTGLPDPKTVKKAIADIMEANKKQFGKANPNVNALLFDNLIDFAKSYLIMIRNLDMTKTA